MAQQSLGWVDGYLNDWTMYIATRFRESVYIKVRSRRHRLH